MTSMDSRTTLMVLCLLLTFACTCEGVRIGLLKDIEDDGGGDDDDSDDQVEIDLFLLKPGEGRAVRNMLWATRNGGNRDLSLNV